MDRRVHAFDVCEVWETSSRWVHIIAEATVETFIVLSSHPAIFLDFFAICSLTMTSWL